MPESSFSSNMIVWRPTRDYIDRSNLKGFMDRHNIAGMDELQKRSTDDISWFTDAVIKFLRIDFQRPYSKVVDLSDGIQFPRWCVDGKLNIVHNCVDKWASDPGCRDNLALIWEGEEGQVRKMTYLELFGEVNRCANGLRSLGYGKGDVIGIFMPMTPEISGDRQDRRRYSAVVLGVW
jgi:acetyl-CoA synthetase